MQSDLVTWRRYLHQRPELGFEEVLTADYIRQALARWQIDHQAPIAKTGIVATIQGTAPSAKTPAPVLALRADMDALPIHEENPVPYRSLHDGKMHACGHDGHTAIALGVAHYLSTHRHTFSGTVKILFQPAEEGPGGAKPMIEAGVLKEPNVDGIIGLHLWNNLPVGTVGVRPGPLMAAVELFECTIQGKGGHGAMPHQTTDAIVVGAQVVNALQTIVARNIDPLAAAVVTVGQFQAGTAQNVIADTAYLSGTVRYYRPELKALIAERVDATIAGICQSHGATYHLDYHALYPPVVNDPAMAALVQSVAEAVIETPVGIVPDCQTMGGEDMAFFLEAVPGCYFFLGSANAEHQLDFPHHHPRFDFDETVLGVGVEILVRCVERFCQPLVVANGTY
jgi:amidohydrolase